MKKITRFGVSMDTELLKDFDHLIEEKKYPNRSEAIRDLVREKLITEKIENPESEGFGALVFIYEHHYPGLADKLTKFQHHYIDLIISSSHVHIDADKCMEVVLLRGKIGQINNIASEILSFKGVQHGKLTLTSSLNLHKHKH